jgi:streptogramin lyase
MLTSPNDNLKLIFTIFSFYVMMIVLLCLSSNYSIYAYQNYVLVQNWERNNDIHKISEIHDVLATKDFVFVPDYENHNIKKFTKNGTFILEWGQEGTDPGQFDTPHSMAIDSQGYVYVSDMSNNRIQKFDNNGTFIIEWGIAGMGAGEFLHPHGMAVDSNDDVYVADAQLTDIQKFNKDGQFSKSEGLDVDPDGYVYVADTGNKRIQVFALSNSTIAPTK